jgi:hypothetical protein
MVSETGLSKIQPLQSALREIEEKALLEFSVGDMVELSGASDKLLESLESAFHG